MIGIYKENWDYLPLLHVVNDQWKDQPLPVLTYFHGFTSAKEHNLPLAFLLAEKGYRVILPDSNFHGERIKDISNDQIQMQFFGIVEQNIKDLYLIKTMLDQKNLVLDDRIGVAGTSMGGITTSAALTQFPWIKAAAVLMGSPKITQYAKELVQHMKKVNGSLPITDQEVENIFQALEEIDLSLHPEKLQDRPLFFWHGEKDSVVPFAHSFSFYEEVAGNYEEIDNIEFVREANKDHKVTRFAILEAVKWLESHL